MDFSYLDKEVYKNIPLLDESHMNPYSDNRQFFIRKYNAGEMKTYLHRHTYVQVNYVYKGSGYHTVGGKKNEIVKGDIFIIPPFVPHEIASNSDKKLEIFEFEFRTDFVLPHIEDDEKADGYLDFAYLEPFMVVEEEMRPRFNLNDKMQNEVESILWEVYEEYEKQNAGYKLVSKALLLKLLVLVGRAFSNEIKGTETEKIFGKYKKAVLKSAQYIDENFSKSLTLDEIASKAGYSKSHFCYLFKSVMGKTYIEYLNEVRVSAAKRLLTETEMSISEIAYEVGYNSGANFNKNFKLITGVTPTSIRKI